MAERLASVETWIAGHDKVCAQRYADIGQRLSEANAGIRDLNGLVRKVGLSIVGALLCLLIYLLIDGRIRPLIGGV